MIELREGATEEELLSSIEAILEGDVIADLANISAYLYHSLPNVNWLGFYLLKNNELIVGPFQGKPACVRIPLNKGVCGAAASLKKTILVDNVEEYPGHIACDHSTKSEIVVPIVKDDELFGVLDIDSPILSRFSSKDQVFFEKLVQDIIIELVLN